MKVKLKQKLQAARKNKKALLAFNVQNFYQLAALKSVTEKLQLPVIIQFSERYLRFLDADYGIDYIVKKFSNQYIYFHLDHCIDLDFIKFCVDANFDSVMYDGSAFNIDTNIENSLNIIEHASKNGCLVEGELGKVSGVEDGFGSEGSSYAEIDEIIEYVTKTKIDLMALGIGNAHGFYSDLEGLKTDILKEASIKLDDNQLYVLHGGTGLPDKIITEAIGYGVVKINVSTSLKKKTIDIMKVFTEENKLYNEIAFKVLMTNELSLFFEEYINKFTK